MRASVVIHARAGGAVLPRVGRRARHDSADDAANAVDAGVAVAISEPVLAGRPVAAAALRAVARAVVAVCGTDRVWVAPAVRVLGPGAAIEAVALCVAVDVVTRAATAEARGRAKPPARHDRSRWAGVAAVVDGAAERRKAVTAPRCTAAVVGGTALRATVVAVEQRLRVGRCQEVANWRSHQRRTHQRYPHEEAAACCARFEEGSRTLYETIGH